MLIMVLPEAAPILLFITHNGQTEPTWLSNNIEDDTGAIDIFVLNPFWKHY